MRLVTWNILEGLLVPGTYTAVPEVDLVRQERAQAIIAELAPDVLVLNEALFCETYNGFRRDYAEIFGFPYALTQLYEGPWGNVILSSHRMSNAQFAYIHPDGGKQNRGAIAAKIATAKGEVWIATFHPHPRRRPFKRANDVDTFLEGLRDAPILLAGDMNAISPDDHFVYADLVRAFQRFTPNGEAAGSVGRFLDAGEMLFRDVLPRFGMTDAMPVATRESTMPTPLLSTEGDSSIRIDHVLATAGVAVTAASVVKNAETAYASDHYPICFDFDLSSVQ